MAVPNQERTQWRPGQSGNPSGRKEGSKNRSTILKKWIEYNCSITDPTTGNEIAGTIEDKIALALVGRAISGDVAAIREIYDSVYGKLDNNKEFDSQLTVTISGPEPPTDG